MVLAGKSRDAESTPRPIVLWRLAAMSDKRPTIREDKGWEMRYQLNAFTGVKEDGGTRIHKVRDGLWMIW